MCPRRPAAVWLALAMLGAAGAVAAGTPPAQGVYTSAVYESEAEMLKGESGPKHGCMWKGREKREGKVICKGALQLKCGRRGWYKTGPC